MVGARQELRAEGSLTSWQGPHNTLMPFGSGKAVNENSSFKM